MSNSWKSAARGMGRWMGLAAAALVVACGGGGGGAIDNPAPPVVEIPVQPPAPANPGSLAVLAGQPGGSGHVDGIGLLARFQLFEDGMAVDSAGNVYVTDGNAYIRRITPQGEVSTWATGVTDGRALVIDKDGGFFVADQRNNRILKVSNAGTVTTYAGTGIGGSADGPAQSAQFLAPRGLALAADGTLYVSEYAGTIRKIGPGGMVSTLAGQRSASGDVDGPGAQARFWAPGPIALDGQGNVLVADFRSVRSVDAAGNVTTLARFDNTDGAGSLAVRNGVIYVRSLATGAVLKLDGSALVPVTGPGPAGYADGAAADARFNGNGAMAFDAGGNLYIADAFNSAIRKLDPQGMVSTVAGSPLRTGRADGPAATASFFRPDSLAQDGAGNLYVSDYLNQTVRRIAGGNVSTFAGTPGTGASYPSYFSDQVLTYPSGLVSDGAGNLSVVEGVTLRLHRVDSSGVLGTSTSSGGESYCYPFCNGGTARGDVVADGAGGYFISDTFVNVIRRIDASGHASVFAGTPSGATSRPGPNGPGSAAPGTYSADGTGAAAVFDIPGGLARDAAGNLFVADSRNNTIRKITPAGVVTTFAGLAGPAGDADGPAATARFNSPAGLAIDGAGNLYVADRGNALVRKITPAGMVTTVAGQRGMRGVVAGALPATLNQPFGLLIGNAGELYVTDQGEHLVLKITLP